MKLIDLLSQEVKDRLKNDKDIVQFDNGWLFNNGGELGFVTNVPMPSPQRPEFFSFGKVNS